MKLRLTLIMLAVLATASVLSAQNSKRMAQIRQAYADRLEMMNNKPYGDQPFNEISVNVAQNMPGSGMREVHDKYYFTQEQYSADGSMCSLLYFATSTVTYAMGMHKWYWEFLWDAMEGDPMFALLVRDEGGTKKEYRFYFENDKVIKVDPELKQWPKDNGGMNLHPQVISKPADVLKLMKEKQAEFKMIIKE
ncbi:MAG: hypothetical protein IK100_06980 [Muribaculaceae bacterium]|nr:hypothetical protein [Muribaculaceae bacterium]MBR5118371.1 hypothetical protein [Muribaculaceae bacterium]